MPCSSDHWAAVAGDLAEAVRFARSNGLDNDDVVTRISHVEQEIAAMEREDGSPDKVSKLPPGERKIMQQVLEDSRAFRHKLWDSKTVDDFEALAGEAQDLHKGLRGKLLRLQIGRLSPGARKLVQERSQRILEDSV